jgi:hypothetical protein
MKTKSKSKSKSKSRKVCSKFSASSERLFDEKLDEELEIDHDKLMKDIKNSKSVDDVIVPQKREEYGSIEIRNRSSTIRYLYDVLCKEISLYYEALVHNERTKKLLNPRLIDFLKMKLNRFLDLIELIYKKYRKELSIDQRSFFTENQDKFLVIKAMYVTKKFDDTKLERTKTKHFNRVCDKCGKPETTVELKACPCGKVHYCGTECQRSDWKEHKKVCVKRADSV